MTPKPFRTAMSRAFSCWPSRIGAASLLALALSWGSEALIASDVDGQATTFEAAAR